ncbi:unnamed protein product [Rangifer tarandus platyrhynchus]|uniref:Uncharacterized protein n=1 Tax=Rangifer tarandus platyrhynchus TaxID=3082113 RepID=A0ABN8YJC2_RANTA|nr:unnamed protein product [Rangifer tarandus platyrhynchus]
MYAHGRMSASSGCVPRCTRTGAYRPGEAECRVVHARARIGLERLSAECWDVLEMEPNRLSSARTLQRAPEQTLEWTREQALYWTLEKTLDWTLERTLGVVDPGAG